MMRVCIVGSSHAAALKAGWERIGPAHPGVSIEFFATGAERIDDLVAADGRLVTDNPALQRTFARITGGRTEIAGDYDCYAVCGAKLTIYRAMAIARRSGVGRRTGRKTDSMPPVSDAALRAAIVAALRETSAGELMRLVRQITRAPIALIASPMPRDTDAPNRPNRIKNAQAGSRIAALFHEAAAAMAAEQNAVYLAQPDATLASPITTKPEYALGGIHLSETERPDDDAHMNADFGAVVMRELMMWVTAKANV